MSEEYNYQNTISNPLSETDVRRYISERFIDVKSSKKIKNLVNFQAMNKYMMMAHDQEELKKMGNIVSRYKKKSLSDILEEYEIHLIRGLEKQPTIKTHTNVINHIFGYFSKDLSQHQKQKFFQRIEEYKREEISLGSALAEINKIVFRFNNTYLASQTYFLLYSDLQAEVLGFRKVNIPRSSKNS